MAGAVILSLLNHYVTAHTKYYGLVLGVIILFYALVLRKGLLDIVIERLRDARERHSAARRGGAAAGSA
jgi:branched-chain amino acid transport system permease protein